MTNKYASHTLLDLHNSTDHAKPHPTISKYVIDIPFKDLFLFLLAFIRNHVLFLLLYLLSFAAVRFYDQFSFLKTPRCTKIKTRLLGLTRMRTKPKTMKKLLKNNYVRVV